MDEVNTVTYTPTIRGVQTVKLDGAASGPHSASAPQLLVQFYHFYSQSPRFLGMQTYPALRNWSTKTHSESVK